MQDKKELSYSEKIIKRIQAISGKYNPHEIFADWVKFMALAFANQVSFDVGRENEYVETVAKYTQEEMAQIMEMCAWLIEWADEEYTDMLGHIYMHLEMGNSRVGQFFTPYHICQLMSQTQEYTSDPMVINEPSCGAGGNIIAVAETMKKRGINYQKNVLAECQDIDIRAVYMCYVQLSLYGVPAIVYQTNTLSDPKGEHSGTGRLYTPEYLLRFFS